MQRTALLFLLAALAAAPALADDFDDALALYQAGDFEAARSRLDPLAEQGDPRAELAIGRIYHLGQGVEQSDEKALYWFQRAADAGLANAQYYLGVMYATGSGTDVDHAAAARWLLAAAEQGDPRAQFGLGSLYLRSDDVDGDGVPWIEKAARAGFADAQYVLGSLYAAGEGGVEQNCVLGTAWNGLAAAQGHERALGALERCADHITPEQKAEAEKFIADFEPQLPGGD